MHVPYRTSVDTHDVDEAREVIARSYTAHAIVPLDRGESFHALHRTASFGGVSFDRLRYVSDIEIRPEGPLATQYCVLQVRRGVVTVRNDGQTLDVGTRESVVFDSARHCDLRWHPGAEVCTVRVDARAMRRAMVDAFGSGHDATRFDVALPGTRAAQHRWNSVVRMLRELALACPDEPEPHPLWSAEVERFVVVAMVATHPAASPSQVHTGPVRVSDVVARKVADYLREHHAEAIGLEEMGPRFGVSARALQLAFHRVYDCTPRAYLRELRLQSAHDDMLADPDALITDIGYRWGFSTPGRFAREYQKRFGVLPSQLERGRSVGRRHTA